MAVTTPKRKADLKVVILGAASIGKTTLIHRYIDGKFKDAISTIGASFSLKQWGHHNIALWDTAGEERFAGLSSFYCRGAGAAILAFDVTSEDSFHALRARFVPLLQAADDNCLLVVVGTKCDLLSSSPREVKQADAVQLAMEVNTRRLTDVPYFETSSRSGQNVEKVFEYIFNQLVPLGAGETVPPSPSILPLRSTSVIQLQPRSVTPPQKNKSACC